LGTVIGLFVMAGLVSAAERDAAASERSSSDESLAAYADAANFQTNGALDLAIDAWQSFLQTYPQDAMASKASHYLGVCYMQRESPDYVAASNAFRQALRDPKYELREESLINHGWCLYAAAGDPPNRDLKRLREALETFTTLGKEFPKSRFIDRALFYSGEAAYGLGEAEGAIQYYDRLLALPSAKDSPLRCDALYARGVAYEDLDQMDKAVTSFEQLLGSCAQSELVTDVHLRLGDAAILRQAYDSAIDSFDAAMESTESEDDLAYALFRQAFALVQSDRAAQATSKYEQLLEQYPDSPYAASATLAAAQSAYRGGQLEIAAKRFEQVLSQNNVAAATEAAHWLARMHLVQGKADQAAKVAQARISAGIEGEFATALRLDLAEALAMTPETVAQSAQLFERVYRDAPQDPLASRALYNASFSALQTGQAQQALDLAAKFVQEFPQDLLLPDVKYISAEASLLAGDANAAAQSYQALLKEFGPESHSQRPIWVLRAAATANAARSFADTIGLLQQQKELQTLKDPTQIAEAQMLLGHAFLMSGKPSDAAKAFEASRQADPQWARAAEAEVLVGQARLAAGQSDEAKQTWKTLVERDGATRMADQARYKLAQLASNAGEHADAAAYYQQILANNIDRDLTPYARYGLGWSLLQAQQYQEAMASLDQVLQENEQHPIAADALLARGITNRNLQHWSAAQDDLEAYLELQPRGRNLGHALYELALIAQQQAAPDQAATRLERLVQEVPDYPEMEKVLYELGWSLRESGQVDAAVKRFEELVSRFPQAAISAEAAFYLGQRDYAAEDWPAAALQFEIAARLADEEELAEKAFYRLGWAHFKAEQYESSAAAFRQQFKRLPEGKFALDALMMIAESAFKQENYKQALQDYEVAREHIRSNQETAQTLRDPSERQVRELILLHGGQSAAQLKDWNTAIEWYDELAERFPATGYLAQAFYEQGYAHQQKGDSQRAIKYFSQVANHYRNEVAARARFMMGEIYFGDRQFAQAIPEFQRVMFGYGAEQAPEEIKNWQAKSGFEAGRCSELLMQQAKTPTAKAKSQKFAEDFFRYVVDKHPEHELAQKSRERLEALTKS